MKRIARYFALLVAACTLLQFNVLGAPPQSKIPVKDQGFVPLMAAPSPRLPNGDMAVALLGSPDYGQLPAGPGNYEILKSKVVAAPEYQYTLPDGQLRIVISDIKITVQRVKTTTNGNERIWTGVQTTYTQYMNRAGAVQRAFCTLDKTCMRRTASRYGETGIRHPKLHAPD
ncbi:exported protein of unknown function [Pararobbsia alpina]